MSETTVRGDGRLTDSSQGAFGPAGMCGVPLRQDAVQRGAAVPKLPQARTRRVVRVSRPRRTATRSSALPSAAGLRHSPAAAVLRLLRHLLRPLHLLLPPHKAPPPAHRRGDRRHHKGLQPRRLLRRHKRPRTHRPPPPRQTHPRRGRPCPLYRRRDSCSLICFVLVDSYSQSYMPSPVPSPFSLSLGAITAPCTPM